MELILIRHGITQGNKERRFIGTLDVPLAPEGEELARAVSPQLPAVEHVYRSPLLRCHQTADLLWPHSGKTVVPALRETDFGPFEGKNHDELKDDPLYQAWLTHADFSKLPVGESADACAARGKEALSHLVADATQNGYQTVGVVSHGGTLMSILSMFARPTQEYYAWMCPNCGGYRVRVGDDLSLEVLSPIGNQTPLHASFKQNDG